MEAWTDAFATWREEIERKVAAGQEDLSGELSRGGRPAARRRPPRRRRRRRSSRLDAAADHLTVDAALDPDLLALVERYPDRRGASTLDAPLDVDVDRPRARFGAWYELFPRSWGGLRGVERAIPQLADLGFDVLYLPPIHPIGMTNRKGAQQRAEAGLDDPGSPWAIGSAERRPRRDPPRPRARSRTSTRWSRRRASTASTSRWTSRSSARPTTRGSRSTRSGSTAAPTGR